MASYPTSVKSFTTKVDNVDTIFAVDVNDLQDEVASLETYNPIDGWTPSPETWTYASATTFTVPGDLTARFSKGVKLRLVQTTTKYFYVVASSFGSPNTTVTITGGIDYTLVNAAITNPNFSLQLHPHGFPHWISWTPTFTNFSLGNGAQTCIFMVVGRLVICRARIVLGTTSSVTGAFLASLPIASLDNLGTSFPAGQCHLVETGVANNIGAAIINTTTDVRALRYAVSGSNIITGDISSTLPFTWGDTDVISLHFQYRM